MARHKRQQLEPEEEPALDISSLIDVCFLLLIYFLVTSTIKPRESDLGLQLPGFDGFVVGAELSGRDPPGVRPGAGDPAARHLGSVVHRRGRLLGEAFEVRDHLLHGGIHQLAHAPAIEL